MQESQIKRVNIGMWLKENIQIGIQKRKTPTELAAFLILHLCIGLLYADWSCKFNCYC